MEFLDDAIVKAKEAIDFACKKTNEVVNIGKNKFDIATLESKLNKDYQKLGEIYFNLIKDTQMEDAKTKELVEAITLKNEQITNLKQQINQNKNVRTCYKCGSVITDADIFCSKCGEKVVFESEE